MAFPDTHCIPTGTLRTSELVPPSISLPNLTTAIPSGGVGHGNIRGVIVYFHGLVNTFPTVPYGFPAVTTTGFANDIQSFVTAVVADGWIVIGVPAQEDFYNGPACLGITNDIANDTGDGLGYLNSTLRTFDHIVDYIDTTYSPVIPIVPMGFSLGAMKVLQIAANRTNILGYIAHCPATILSNAALNYTKPANFNILNTSGDDLSAHQLDSVTVPGILGSGTNDAAVGFGGRTNLTSASNGQPVGSLTQLSVSSNTNFLPGAALQLVLTGGALATFSFTGSTAGLITGVTLLSGTGTTATGNLLTQSRILDIAFNALVAGQPITSNQTSDHHEWTTADSATYAAYVASTLDPIAPPLF